MNVGPIDSVGLNDSEGVELGSMDSDGACDGEADLLGASDGNWLGAVETEGSPELKWEEKQRVRPRGG